MRDYAGTAHLSMPYQLYKPKNFDPAREYPVLLYMHGLGSNGDDNITQITNSSAEVLRLIESEKRYCGEIIIIAPHCPRGSRWVEWNPRAGGFGSEEITEKLAVALAIFDYWFDNMVFDKDRIYLWGNSMGAFASYDLMQRFPARYAAAVLVAGLGRVDHANTLCKNNLWIHHGDADPTVPFDGNVLMYNELKKHGADDNVLFTVYEGKGHNIFADVGKKCEIVDWMLSKSLKGEK